MIKIKKVKDGNLFDIGVSKGIFINIYNICYRSALIWYYGVPGYIDEYVKAVLGVSVEKCDKILVDIRGERKYWNIAFVKGDVCLKLSYGDDFKGLKFILTCINDKLNFDNEDYMLDLYGDDDCFAITLPYMERILGVKHDENYISISYGGDKINDYSFYGQIFHDLSNDLKGFNTNFNYNGDVKKIFTDLFQEEEELKEIDENMFQEKKIKLNYDPESDNE